MEKILVPTDFSTCAGKAIDFVVRISKYVPCSITLCHAFDLQGELYTDYMGVSKAYNQSLYNDVVKKMEALKRSIFQTHQVAVDFIVPKTSFKKLTTHVAREMNIDLIVMGTEGASRLGNRLFGSNTSTAIANGEIPVLTIPGDYEWKKPERVLLSIHDFEDAAPALDFLFEMTDAFAARVDAVHFSDDASDLASEVVVHTRKVAKFEEVIRKNYQKPDFAVNYLSGQNFLHSMQDYIDKYHVDLVAMFTHKRTFIEEIFHPSVTRKMSYHTHIPLLAIPSGNK